MSDPTPKKHGRISAELLQKIKDAVNITDVVGEHVVLRKSGANFSGLCPFHSERSPSFSVTESKQLFYCYGCKKGGDLIGFVTEIYGISFLEAIEDLAERAKIALPSDWNGEDSNDPETQKRRAAAREKTATAYRLNRFAAAFFHSTLSQLPAVEKYFENRGVGSELRRAFYVGAAPAAWDGLASHLVAKKAPLPLAVELGLIQPSQKNAQLSGPGYFDLFRNRAMFPILDTRGKVVGFGGRAMGSASAEKSEGEGPKYLNSKESTVFQKSQLAFGMFQAQKHIREKNEVILVEGYFDVLALHAAGFQNAVATCGTSLTREHLKLFGRFADKVIVLFDGDKAGISATARAMEVGLEAGQILYGAAMPEGLDPDEVLFSQNTGQPKPGGLEQMKTILAAAKPLLDSRIDDAVQYASQGPEQKTVALKQAAQWLVRYTDPVGREIRVQALQNRLGISRQLMNQAMGVTSGAGGRSSSSTPVTPTPRPVAPVPILIHNGLGRSEDILIHALVRLGLNSQPFQRASQNLPKANALWDLFEHPELRDFAEKFQAYTDNPAAAGERNSQLNSLLSTIQDSKARSSITEAIMQEEKTRYSEEEIKIAVDRSLGRLWARFSQQIKIAIAQAEAKKDAGLQAILMKEYLDVQRKLKEFSSFYDEA
ncbi:MAG: DNA primase [Bdellovibrionales bacterium GWB1_52_6]|nr:MAG: DNA primase [Bdellovibrionales bacterium GWB1_52_6]OFZ02488.1 MAG: DNA primase [Bdellovibrionales bacterium GWA1_52_35]HCM41332.1 DNA primase [Bdellovibrionales bacterium]